MVEIFQVDNNSHECGLKLLLDSADTTIWQRLLPSGLFYGVTTNPKLLQQAGVACTLENLTRLARTAFEMGAQEVHLQTWGMQEPAMTRTGCQLAAIDPRIMVKVPATPPGYQTARALIAESVGVTLTAMHSASQVLAALALGTRYAVPYLGRMNDAGLDGLAEVIAMQEILDHHPGPTQLLLASLRQLRDVVTLARHGVAVFTLLPTLVESLLENPLTLKASQDFEACVNASLRESNT